MSVNKRRRPLKKEVLKGYGRLVKRHEIVHFFRKDNVVGDTGEGSIRKTIKKEEEGIEKLNGLCLNNDYPTSHIG